MLSGMLFLALRLFMRTNMVLPSFVPTTSCAFFSPVSSRILQIILRSECWSLCDVLMVLTTLLPRVLIASIKSLAMCLCPRCLIRKQQVGDLGTKNDRKRRKKDRADDEHHRKKVARAREGIFEKGYKVTGAKVERMLGEESIAPIKVSCQLECYPICCLLFHSQNAFTSKLSEFGFNLYEMMVVDLLHEFEIGVWKSIFTHLMRILYAFGHDAIQQLNRRFVSL
jgi:hypothetical protein